MLLSIVILLMFYINVTNICTINTVAQLSKRYITTFQ